MACRGRGRFITRAPPYARARHTAMCLRFQRAGRLYGARARLTARCPVPRVHGAPFGAPRRPKRDPRAEDEASAHQHGIHSVTGRRIWSRNGSGIRQAAVRRVSSTTKSGFKNTPLASLFTFSRSSDQLLFQQLHVFREETSCSVRSHILVVFFPFSTFITLGAVC